MQYYNALWLVTDVAHLVDIIRKTHLQIDNTIV